MLKYLNHKALAVLSVAALSVPAFAEGGGDIASAFSTQFNNAVTMLGGLTAGIISLGGVVIAIAGTIAGFGVIKRMVQKV